LDQPSLGSPHREQRWQIRTPARLIAPIAIRTGLGAVLAVALALLLGLPSLSRALIFGSPDTEPLLERPDEFPYWKYITQRRYEGPSVIYLGAGFALTARHVGMGEISLEETIHAPNLRSQHTLLNENGTAADAMVFELEGDKNPPDWPLIPIAILPPQPGEQVDMARFAARSSSSKATRDPISPFFGVKRARSDGPPIGSAPATSQSLKKT